MRCFGSLTGIFMYKRLLLALWRRFFFLDVSQELRLFWFCLEWSTIYRFKLSLSSDLRLNVPSTERITIITLAQQNMLLLGSLKIHKRWVCCLGVWLITIIQVSCTSCVFFFYIVLYCWRKLLLHSLLICRHIIQSCFLINIAAIFQISLRLHQGIDKHTLTSRNLVVTELKVWFGRLSNVRLSEVKTVG